MPTCFALEGVHQVPTNRTSADTLASFTTDCVDAMRSFLTWPTISSRSYLWKRMSRESIPPSGEQPLPFTIGRYSCVLELDVLDNSGAQDRFALQSLKDEVVSLYDMCVLGEQHSGTVAVGPQRVIGLTMKPKSKHQYGMLQAGANDASFIDIGK
ncbi:hypothetical protein ACLMJK_005357 [Lecanora helva]